MLAFRYNLYQVLQKFPRKAVTRTAFTAAGTETGPISEITRLITSGPLSRKKFSAFHQERIINNRIYYDDRLGGNG